MTKHGDEQPAAPPGRREQILPAIWRRIPRWVLWMVAILVPIGIAFLLVLAYFARNAEPILRQRVIANLQQRFQSHVELDELHISVLKGLQVSGGGLRIDAPPGQSPETAPSSSGKTPTANFNARINTAPMIVVRHFSFRTSLRQLMEHTMHIDMVRVDGLRLRIPPKSHSDENPQPGAPRKKGRFARMFPAGKHGPSNWKIVVDTIHCTDVILTIETDKPDKQPLIFPIRDVVLHGVGHGTPMPFEAHLINAKPVGEIASTGHFGPWVPGDPRAAHVDGGYSFTHADLDTIKGIGGILSSTGNYSGTLGRIDVIGTTDTPDFSLDIASHAMPLHTVFNATVDGTTGDTILNAIHATLGKTVLDVKGSVIRTGHKTTPMLSDLAESAAQAAEEEDSAGHRIEIAVISDHARIEDVLALGVHTVPPLMSGAMTLQAHLAIPPGHISVSKKMQVEGSFTIHDTTFSNPKWQDTVDKLSARASGNPQQAKAGADAQRVESSIAGTFALANAVLKVPKVQYRMPGASVDVAGRYSLDGNTFDFTGTARTTATASHMLTGWKSLLAKPFDKLLEKDGAGVEVPITISGTRSAPKFGVNAGKLAGQIMSHLKGGSKDNGQPPEQAPPAPPKK